MSGHSKWHSIKHKKGLADAKKGAVFTKHAKLIALAAKSGGDPETNPGLRVAIDDAKVDNVPNLNIERAIKRGTGELKDEMEITEGFYDAYGPSATAFFIQYLTDNKNRTLASIKTLLNKHGGRMGEAGTVAWMFEQKGLIQIEADKEKHEEIELASIDAGAEDFESEDNSINIYTEPTSLHEVKKRLEENGYKTAMSKLIFKPKNSIKISDKVEAAKVIKLVSLLEDDEDVVNVFSNFDIEENLLNEIVGEE